MISNRFTLAVLLSLALAPCLATAQGDKPAKPEPKAPEAQTEPKAATPSPQPFLLTLTVTESDSGKPTAEKTYTLTIIADDTHGSNESLRDADNIPYKSEKGQEYQAIGTNMDFSNATRQGDTLIVMLTVSNKSLAEINNDMNPPQNHEWRIHVAAALHPGKPTVVYSATDAITGHKVEVLATAKLLDTK
jgi:hypothetical protein